MTTHREHRRFLPRNASVARAILMDQRRFVVLKHGLSFAVPPLPGHFSSNFKIQTHRLQLLLKQSTSKQRSVQLSSCFDPRRGLKCPDQRTLKNLGNGWLSDKIRLRKKRLSAQNKNQSLQRLKSSAATRRSVQNENSRVPRLKTFFCSLSPLHTCVVIKLDRVTKKHLRSSWFGCQG